MIGPAEQALTRARWQAVLFAPRPSRSALLELVPQAPLAPLRIGVHRNQPFEFVASAMPAFLAFAGWKGEIELGPYDDALSLLEVPQADVHVVWMDPERYSDPASYAAFLQERVAALRAATSAPIVVLGEAPAGIPGVVAGDLTGLQAELGDRWLDLRAMRVTGMKLSDAACVAIARKLAFELLPVALRPRLKAVVVDLDHTLYAGVLGEDGIDGVALTDAHAALQRDLVALRDQGIFLAICSRNEPADVEALLARRADFPLRPEHLSASSVSWRPKAEGLREIAAKLRIGLDALLFVDDNPGEIAAIAESAPGVHLLHAADADSTRRALARWPALHGYPRQAVDQLRAADLAANEEREKIAAEAADPAAYLASLQVRLTFALDPARHAQRLADMSVKTNQFNTASKRFSPAEVAARLADPRSRLVSIAMSDRLSDSGVIGFLAARSEGDRLVVEELCVSCRALGRQIEDLLVTEAIRGITAELPASEVVFEWAPAPRNEPARTWLARYAGEPPVDRGVVRRAWNARSASDEVEAMPVRITWEERP
jgi:FkbH-like protein